MKERKTGYWENDSYCSVCKRFPLPVDMGIPAEQLTELFNYCPYCGSDLVGASVETFAVKGAYNGET